MIKRGIAIATIALVLGLIFAPRFTEGCLAFIVLYLVGAYVFCRTKNEPFRRIAPPGAPVIETTSDYTLGFVEFDDQGWFWDIGQKKEVEKMIKQQMGIDPPGQPQGILLIVFAHGWKNNAAVDNKNVTMFRQTLQQIGEAEKSEAEEQRTIPRKVVGIYAGWRGLSVWPFVAIETTFYGRMTTAHKVGGYGALTELLVELESLQQAGNDRPNAPRTELIIVGHSMGAAAVYSAIAQMVTERFVNTVKKGCVLKPLGDQVILLNPAFEAARHHNLNQLAASITRYPAGQRPVLSIFTSKGDEATGEIFPWGRFFATIFQKCRDTAQRQAIRYAVGWYPPFVTHDLIYKPPTPAGAAVPASAARADTHSTFNFTTKKHELRRPDQLPASLANVHLQRAKWHPNKSHPASYEFDDCCLQPRKFRPGDPFLIVSVDKKIMKNHNDLTNPVLINFLGEYILFCRK